MKIALLGYGKMGKAIEAIAIDRGHSIVIKANADTDDYDITEADVAIDFSVPSSAFKNISRCLSNGVPVISGTTGWLQDYDKAVELCNANEGAFIYASNFSLGVNLFFELNRVLANLMKGQPQYQVSMEEIHHTQKLDAPSGTAITLAEGIIDNNATYNNWTLEAPQEDQIQIEAKRIADVPGTHVINYDSEIDSIQISHTAHNRQGFALGAVIAAEWIVGKKGVFSMKNVLNIG
ncbi:4-hydroxy-tetrahydrodipicolinate reductase [Mangrovimonas sp. YM274]|uniref:4-hydroxy-tetrahydrodipicolinate reductase n=1 Tax=Mangrovimonas sp. YM274 TaxID=3070660 RepID=UPI0027DCF3C6|nr:4-hydroxy-tetrahydrodipicolinate reductase [Mangrovimonas sp. YM274]WMI67792.1 4-hydroxy-tetrahydrodipicolinate reductase [Mangrovimonas sp. YM274]